MTDVWLDGNALGGALREVFALDVTAANARCAGCGRIGPVAEAHVYARTAGLVARCPGCDSVLMRVVTAPDRVFLDMHGISFLELRSPE
jgi:Zn finger protein HypA/HybF involved in hydrogenase expression